MKKHRLFVDAVAPEGARLILADGETAFFLPRALLPDGLREGDTVELSITPQAQKRRRKGR